MDRLRLRDAAADAAWDAMAEPDAFGLRLAPVVLPAPGLEPPVGLHAAIGPACTEVEALRGAL